MGKSLKTLFCAGKDRHNNPKNRPKNGKIVLFDVTEFVYLINYI